ncbi:unnamed protein product, partial [marine sediment metagenome]
AGHQGEYSNDIVIPIKSMVLALYFLYFKIIIKPIVKDKIEVIKHNIPFTISIVSKAINYYIT